MYHMLIYLFRLFFHNHLSDMQLTRGYRTRYNLERGDLRCLCIHRSERRPGLCWEEIYGTRGCNAWRDPGKNPRTCAARTPRGDGTPRDTLPACTRISCGTRAPCSHRTGMTPSRPSVWAHDRGARELEAYCAPSSRKNNEIKWSGRLAMISTCRCICITYMQQYNRIGNSKSKRYTWRART